MAGDNIAALCRDWIDAKNAEAAASAERIAIELQLAKALDVPSEGSKTHKIEGYKVTVTQPVARKVDADAWDAVKGSIDPAFWPIKTKIEADATGCKWMVENAPETWAKIARAFETKPGKIGFKVVEAV